MSRADALVLPAIVPPTPRSESDPVGWLDGLIIIGALVLTFWVAVRLVTWLTVKLSSWMLFIDINRDVSIGGPAASGQEGESIVQASSGTRSTPSGRIRGPERLPMLRDDLPGGCRCCEGCSCGCCCGDEWR